MWRGMQMPDWAARLGPTSWHAFRLEITLCVRPDKFMFFGGLIRSDVACWSNFDPDEVADHTHSERTLRTIGSQAVPCRL